VNFLKKLFSGSTPPPDSAKEMSRNAPCWCGSGKKYKQCHHAEDRNYFTSQQNEGCQGPT
jgi:uncharacterized protein YecA (UPF0149 family)